MSRSGGAKRPGAGAVAPLETEPLDGDAAEGFHAPRRTAERVLRGRAKLYGLDGPAAAVREAFEAGRGHHAWILRGPRGVGKATLALTLAAERVAADGDLAGSARFLALGAHPAIFELSRAWNDKTKKFKTTVAVDDARRLQRFFALSAADGGWRAAVIDPVDQLTREAANALLKLIEEPPARTLFLLVAHGEAPTPATILSRCRKLAAPPLSREDAKRAFGAARDGPEIGDAAADSVLALSAAEAGGGFSPGAAARLFAADGAALYAEILALYAAFPRRDGPSLERLAGRIGRAGGLERFEALVQLLPRLFERLARAGALGARAAGLTDDEAALAARVATDLAAARFWAEAAATARRKLGEATRLNLDPGRTLLDIHLGLEDEAARSAAGF